MQSIGELKRRVAGYLQEQEGFAGVRVREAFPGAQRDYPLRGPVVAVGLDSVDAAPEGFGGYWGETGGDGLHGAGARITLRFDLYAADGGGLHALYEALCDHLLLRGSPFGVCRLWCGETQYDRTAGAHRMAARAELRSALLVRERAGRLDEVVVVRAKTGTEGEES